MPKQRTITGCLNLKKDIAQYLCLASSFYLTVKESKQSAAKTVRNQHEHAVAVVKCVTMNEPRLRALTGIRPHLSLKAMLTCEGKCLFREGLSSGSRAALLTLGGPLGGAHP